MADSTGAAPAAPPKKRSFFKKAAWQTATKEEAGKETDIFSHSNEYKDIVAEQTKQRLREKKEKAAREEERKRRADADRDAKKRKLSVEDVDEVKMPSSGSQGSGKRKRESRELSKSPFSPSTRDVTIPTYAEHDTLSTRYESAAKSTRSNSKTVPSHKSNVVDLGDSDSDDPFSLPSLPRSSFNAGSFSIPNPAPAPTDDIEEVEDPRLAALAAQARERQRLKEAAQSASPQAATPTVNTTAKLAPPVQLLITSDIEGTQPLQVKIRIDSIVDRPRLAWCAKQGLSAELTRNVFLTWKSKRLANTTTIRRLGVKEENGEVFLEDDPTISTDDELPKIHVEAWTEETFKEVERRKREDAEARKRAVEPPPMFVEEEPAVEPTLEVPKIRLFLKAKDKDDFKIQVKPDTTIDHLTSAYKKSRKIPDDEPITLYFDGSRLSPMDTITDAEIEDMDTIEVHFK